MSDWHALGSSDKGNRIEIVVHTAVPNTTNDAAPTNINHRVAAAEYVSLTKGSTVSRLPGIVAGEQTQLDNGELVESVINVEFDANQTPAQRHAAVAAAAGVEQAEVGADMTVILQYWGGDGSAT